jgi:hypothetical protein
VDYLQTNAASQDKFRSKNNENIPGPITGPKTTTKLSISTRFIQEEPEILEWFSLTKFHEFSRQHGALLTSQLQTEVSGPRADSHYNPVKWIQGVLPHSK